MTLRLRYAVRSHVGIVREGNEDSAYAGSRLVMVADGMGGHAAGEVASSAAVSSLAHLDDDEAGIDVLDVLAAGVQDANDVLRDMVAAQPSLDGMGTTLTVMLASGSRLGVAHVGDSRAYLLRDGELTLVTHDQTLVQRMVDEGQITAEQAETHPQRALLTQALDGRQGVEPDLSLREARRGDRYLLCTDGLSGVVHAETMAETLSIPDADAAAERLIELTLKGGGPDNVTVIVADVVDEAAGLSDTPVVAGAAAESDAVPGAVRLGADPHSGLASAAEKARRLLPSRRRSAGARADDAVERPPGDTDPNLPAIDPDADPPGTRRRRRLRRRPLLVVGGVVVVLAAAVLATWGVVRTQWYVGEHDDRVAVFHGVRARPLGVPLSSVQREYFPMPCLQPVSRSIVRTGYVARSRADALRFVDNLRTLPSYGNPLGTPAATGPTLSATDCAVTPGSTS